MYILAKVHPELQQQDNPGGNWLNNRTEREKEIERFYEQKSELPLDLNHQDIGRYGLVPYKNRVGRVVDLFNNAEGELMMKAYVDLKHANSPQIKQWMQDHKKPLGVSPGVCQTPDGRRHLVHVALTQDPAFARYGTYVQQWSRDEEAMDREIALKYYNETPQQFYAHQSLRDRLKSMFQSLHFYFHVIYIFFRRHTRQLLTRSRATSNARRSTTTAAGRSGSH
jgi:hypothetical protein